MVNKYPFSYFVIILCWTLFLFNDSKTIKANTVVGELKKWHTLELAFEGPTSSESSTPNPFLDYKMTVVFTSPSNKNFIVPGHFAADGNAANTSSSSGNKWRVYFVPGEVGLWKYKVHFIQGPNIAVQDSYNNGQSANFFDGYVGDFSVAENDKNINDPRSKGRLTYVGEHYLQYAETKEFFIKGGTDSPENFLAYTEFDGTVKIKNNLKTWTPHLSDFEEGPVWKDGRGKGILGAVNYLSSVGVNALSFLTLSYQGDDGNVFPYSSRPDSPESKLRFDVSKLDQWGRVFDYATSKGIYLHFKLQETENDTFLDSGNLGIERKLYYREMVSRYSHNLALNWNLGEEFSPGGPEVDRARQYSGYIKSIDPYKNHIVLHTYPNDHDKYYLPLVKDKTLTGPSIQTGWNRVYASTLKWVRESNNYSKTTGQKWVVANDEQGGYNHGVIADNDNCGVSLTQDALRKEVLWGNLMAGGAGVEYYFGYNCKCDDLSCEDYRTRENMWRYTSNAIQFFKLADLPLVDMYADNNLATSGWVFAKPQDTYLIYLKSGGTTSIKDLKSGQIYSIYWYNPRAGGGLTKTKTINVLEDGSYSVGNSPSDQNDDWVVLAKRESGSVPPPNHSGAFVEKNGLIVMQVESANIVGDWVKDTQLSGYTGSSYYTWLGPDHFNNPGNGELSYKIKIENPGMYKLNIYNRHDFTDSTEENDVWVKVNNGQYIKTFSSVGGKWVWNSQFDHPPAPLTGQPQAQFELSTGYNTLYLSGRSKGFSIDRIHMYLSSVADPLNLSLPESQREGSNSVYASSDLNANGSIELYDIIFLIKYLFSDSTTFGHSGANPDVDNNGVTNLKDVITLIKVVFM